MSAPVRCLVVMLAALALAAGAGACGADSDEGAGGDGDRTTAGNGAAGKGGNGGGKQGDGGGGEDEEEFLEEEPTASNEVLLGAQFFGEKPADFGAVALGKTRTISFVLKSLGTARTISGTSIVGENAGDFSLSPGTCTNGAVVDAGESCTVLVTFRPSATGERKASLRVAIDPGVSGGRSMTGTGGLTPPPPPATETTRGGEPEDTGGTKPEVDDTGGTPAAPGAQAPQDGGG